MQEVLLKLSRSLAHTEDQIKRVQAEVKAVNTEQAAVGRAHTKVSLMMLIITTILFFSEPNQLGPGTCWILIEEVLFENTYLCLSIPTPAG